MADSIFTAADIDRLFEERFLHPHPMIQKRLEALYLKSQGMKHKEICILLRISRASIANWLKTYKESGIDGVKALNYRKQWGELTSHQRTLEEHFRQHPPRTVQEAARVIKELTGLERQSTSVHRFLKITGLSYRKTGIVPGKADPQTQEEFKKKRSSRSWKTQDEGIEKCSS
jgi:transposase